MAAWPAVRYSGQEFETRADVFDLDTRAIETSQQRLSRKARLKVASPLYLEKPLKNGLFLEDRSFAHRRGGGLLFKRAKRRLELVFAETTKILVMRIISVLRRRCCRPRMGRMSASAQFARFGLKVIGELGIFSRAFRLKALSAAAYNALRFRQGIITLIALRIGSPIGAADWRITHKIPLNRNPSLTHFCGAETSKNPLIQRLSRFPPPGARPNALPSS